MYYLFKHKNIMPRQFYKMPAGERMLAAAFAEKECEEG